MSGQPVYRVALAVSGLPVLTLLCIQYASCLSNTMLYLWVADNLPGYMVLPTMTTIWVVFISIAVFCVWDVEDLPANRHRAQCLDYLSIVHRDMRLGSRPDCLYDTPMSGSLFMWYFALSPCP